jgi:hypothetical protein
MRSYLPDIPAVLLCYALGVGAVLILDPSRVGLQAIGMVMTALAVTVVYWRRGNSRSRG